MGRERAAQGASRPVVAVENGLTVLRVGGVIQSVRVDAAYRPDVWDAMLPAERPANALILGLGGGTVANLLTARFGPLPITGVEIDPAVIYLARHAFGLEPHVQVVQADAFAYVRTCQERYALVCVDLYTAGIMAHGVLANSFLRDIARLLVPGGMATFNLWRTAYLADALRRIERVLPIHETVRVDDNLLVRCAAPVR